jgi:hypothetical protein
MKSGTRGLRLGIPFHLCRTPQELIDPNRAPGGNRSGPERGLAANTLTSARTAQKPILLRLPTSSGQCLSGLVPSLGGPQELDAGSGDPAYRGQCVTASATHQNPGGAVSGRSEPWRRTLQPLAHSAKADPSQSLLSERRPDTAEPPCLQRTHPAAHHHSPPLTNPTRSFSPAIRTLQSTRSYESLRDDCPRLRPQLP